MMIRCRDLSVELLYFNCIPYVGHIHFRYNQLSNPVQQSGAIQEKCMNIGKRRKTLKNKDIIIQNFQREIQIYFTETLTCKQFVFN